MAAPLSIGAGISVGSGISFGGSPAGDPYIANVISLIPMTGTIGTAPVVTYGTTNTLTPYGTPPVISAAQSKWGTTSTVFDGNGHLYLSVLPAISGDFTWETFAYPVDVSVLTMIFSNYTNTGGRVVYIQAGQLVLNNTGTPIISGGSVIANEWCHVALSRTSGTTKLFLNGQQVGSSWLNDTYDYSGQTTKLGIGG